MSIEVLYDHCPIMEGNIEAIRDKVPPDQAAELALGGEVSVFRFPLTKGQHGVITIYWDSMRFALFMGAGSTWGDVEHTNKLWPDDKPEFEGGPWWIDPEMAAWVEEYESSTIPLDPEQQARLTVDMENNTEAWWDALRDLKAQATPATQSEQDLLKILDPGRDEVRLPLERARAAFALAQALPGWSDPDAPEFAPHPILGYGIDTEL